MYVFFFKQKTAYEMRISDWSSDVCASDLLQRDQGDALALYRPEQLVEFTPVDQQSARAERLVIARAGLLVFRNMAVDQIEAAVLRSGVGFVEAYAALAQRLDLAAFQHDAGLDHLVDEVIVPRSEERRVGKECVSTVRSRGWP